MSTKCQRLLSISMTVIPNVFTPHLPILSFQSVKKNSIICPRSTEHISIESLIKSKFKYSRNILTYGAYLTA